MTKIWGQRLERKQSFKLKCPPGLAFKIIFGSLKLKLQIDNKNILIGRGSSGCLTNIRYYKSAIEEQTIFQVGDFSEFADSRIILGGEHRNSHLFNGALNSFPHVASEVAASSAPRIQPLTTQKGPLNIGSNVLVSFNSVILSGISIEDGIVIGAGSVVTKCLEKRAAIYAGSPARHIGWRFNGDCEKSLYDAINWELIDIHDYFWLMETISNSHPEETLKCIKKATTTNTNNRSKSIVFSASKSPANLLVPKEIAGVQVDDKFIPISELPNRFVEYLRQGTNQNLEIIEWIPDPFDYFCIC